jgi:hypothetical protein
MRSRRSQALFLAALTLCTLGAAAQPLQLCSARRPELNRPRGP